MANSRILTGRGVTPIVFLKHLRPRVLLLETIKITIFDYFKHILHNHVKNSCRIYRNIDAAHTGKYLTSLILSHVKNRRFSVLARSMALIVLSYEISLIK